MFLPESIIKKFEKKNFAEATIRNFDNSMKRVFKLVYGSSAEFDIQRLVKDYKKVIKTLSSPDIPMTSRRLLYHSIGNVIKAMGLKSYGARELIKVRDIITPYIDEKRRFEATEPVIPLEDIYPLVHEKFEEYEEKLKDEYDPKIDVPYVALAFFVHLPPFRAQDYVTSKLLDKKPDDETAFNYVDLKKGRIVINEYKTVKKHGQRKITLPPELLHILKEYKKRSGSEWLIPKLFKTKEEPMTSSSFTHMLNRVFDEKISTTELRRAYVSQEVINKDMKGKQRKEVAKMMAHSTATQGEIYSKYSKLAD